MIHENPIFRAYEEALHAKGGMLIVSMRCRRLEENPTHWRIKFGFNDDQPIIKNFTELDHNEFMTKWDEFCTWLNRIRGMETGEEGN